VGLGLELVPAATGVARVVAQRVAVAVGRLVVFVATALGGEAGVEVVAVKALSKAPTVVVPGRRSTSVLRTVSVTCSVRCSTVLPTRTSS
jgi:hypothetical protein